MRFFVACEVILYKRYSYIVYDDFFQLSNPNMMAMSYPPYLSITIFTNRTYYFYIRMVEFPYDDVGLHHFEKAIIY